MLSEQSLNNRISKFDRPLLEQPITYRVAFCKRGNLQYFSHLDLQRTWQRVLVRASIPMWYTQGFNPHSKIIFGIPLPVGVEGLREMVDLRVDREISAEEMKQQLNQELTEEMAVSEVYVPTAPFADIVWGQYELTLCSPELTAREAQAVKELFSPGASPIVMTKRTKSGDKQVDILPLIQSLSVAPDPVGNGKLTVRTTLATGNGGSLNPEYLVTAIRERLGLLSDLSDPEKVWYTILRTGFLTADGQVFR
jgi:radical SAM-linked protein